MLLSASNNQRHKPSEEANTDGEARQWLRVRNCGKRSSGLAQFLPSGTTAPGRTAKQANKQIPQGAEKEENILILISGLPML